jgi:hypothetical protein
VDHEDASLIRVTLVITAVRTDDFPLPKINLRTPVDHVVLAWAAGTDSADPIRSRRSSGYQQIVDRATILRVAMSAKEFVWSEKR